MARGLDPWWFYIPSSKHPSLSTIVCRSTVIKRIHFSTTTYFRKTIQTFSKQYVWYNYHMVSLWSSLSYKQLIQLSQFTVYRYTKIELRHTPPHLASRLPISLFNDCTMYMLKYFIHWWKNSSPTQPIKLANYSFHFLWPLKSFLCNTVTWPKEGLKMSIIPVP